MNYIKLINTFWQIRREREDFDPYVITLYFTLLDIANRNTWKSFSLYREDIVQLSSMSPKSYYKAREILKDAGLIAISEGANGVKKCTYTILPLCLQETVQDTHRKHSGIHIGNSEVHTEETVQTTILDKPINIETNKPLNNNNTLAASPESEKAKAILDAVEPEVVNPPKPKEEKQTDAGREIFEQARKLYPGSKRGDVTEWENFEKKFKKNQDFKTLPALILTAIEKQIKYRAHLVNTKARFIPEWPHLATWINNARWEEELPEITESKPTQTLIPKSITERLAAQNARVYK